MALKIKTRNNYIFANIFRNYVEKCMCNLKMWFDIFVANLSSEKEGKGAD